MRPAMPRVFALALLASPLPLFAADWPHWRGPNRSGITDEASGWTGGKRVWGRNLYDDYKAERRPHLGRGQRRDYGYTSSALVHHDWLLVEVGSTKFGSIIAFDKKTGKEAWASELKEEAGHTGGMSP